MKYQGSLRIGCLCVGLCLIFVMLCPAIGLAGTPTLGPTHRASGPPVALPGDREGWWDEPPDLYGSVMSSEIISILGFETETANDFYSSAPTIIYEAVWWGEYFNDDGTGPNVSAFNLRFYDDAGGVPGSLIAEYPGTTPTETIPQGQGPDGPIYEYHASVTVDIGVGSYWFSVQACDHVYPPQWGRLSAGQVTGYQSMLRSEWAGYPDWTPTEQIWGIPLDASQRFYTTPPVVGACCYFDLHCESLVELNCDQLGGVWQGPETTCDPNPCPFVPMACCFPDGHCEPLSQAACDEGGGSSGVSINCDPNTCPQPSMACCFWTDTVSSPRNRPAYSKAGFHSGIRPPVTNHSAHSLAHAAVQ